ncbi:MAG: c-type cytochrome [Bacteroidetes bacterium]|nr:c-type cytochrome [Bacteroidota bacterium]
MKKLIKIIGVLIGLIVLLIAGGLIYINASGIPHYKTTPMPLQVQATSASIARGQKLVYMLCMFCHKDPNTGRLTGKKLLDIPPEFGEVYSRNITQDKEQGIGAWTDGEIAYLLRTGVAKDGHYTPPYMVKLPNLADDDINAIISFLRSDNPMVAADPTPDIPSSPSLLTKLLCRVAFHPLPLPTHKIELPDTNNAVQLGRYLAVNLGCSECHSKDFKTNNQLEPEQSEGYFGGGNQPLNEQGQVMLTPNITPDKATGIGNWTKDEFIKTLKTGQVKNQPALRYPMEPYVLLTDAEAGAIFEYLMTIPAIDHEVKRSGI